VVRKYGAVIVRSGSERWGISRREEGVDVDVVEE